MLKKVFSKIFAWLFQLNLNALQDDQAELWSKPPSPDALWLCDLLKSHFLIYRICLNNPTLWFFFHFLRKYTYNVNYSMVTFLYINMAKYHSFKKCYEIPCDYKRAAIKEEQYCRLHCLPMLFIHSVRNIFCRISMSIKFS